MGLLETFSRKLREKGRKLGPATITEMGSVYMSVVVGMTTAVQIPEGMI